MTSPDKTEMFSEGTNSSKLDFAEYNGTVSSFIIASTPRSGSTLLGHLLWKSRMGGAPHEYFNPKHAEDYRLRWNYRSQAEYLSKLKRWRTSPNGQFGVKLHFYQIREFGLDLKKLEEALDNPKYIFLKRKTKIRQAISLVKAMQTNQFSLQSGETLKNAEYDFEFIKSQYFRLISEENHWEKYLHENNKQPLVVTYEDIAKSYAGELRRVFEFIGVPEDEHVIPEPGLKKMSDTSTEEWVGKFNADLSEYKSKEAQKQQQGDKENAAI